MAARTKARLKQAARNLFFPTPAHLLAKQIQIDSNGLDEIRKSVKEKYHTGWRSESNYSPERYHHDLQAQLRGRLERDRKTVIPWLDKVGAIRDKRILEIGCGTGSSTVALVEQGGLVVGIDIDEGSLAVARDRCAVYGVEADFRSLNADEISATFGTQAFDTIVFYACLEHMTIAERLASLKDAWASLPEQGLLVIVETPNRLWYFDGHTAKMPFFNWLPDELAFHYSRFSSRVNFRELYRNYDAESIEHFLRRGRGMSFHELDLAIGPSADLNVISSRAAMDGISYRLRQSRIQRRYKSLLKAIHPGLHDGFFDEMLYLIVRK